MHRLKLTIGVILVFAAGTLAGSLGTGVYLKKRMEQMSVGGPPPHLRSALLIHRLSRELDLNETQRHDIEKIVEESEGRILAIRREYLPEIKEIVDQSFELMKDKLDSKQKEKLDKLHERLKNRHSKAFFYSVFTERTPEEILSKMRNRLSLTETQESEVRPLIEKSVEERRKIAQRYKEEDHPEIPLLRREMRGVQESLDRGLAGILTDQQMEEYQKMQKEDRSRFRSEMRRPRPGGFD